MFAMSASEGAYKSRGQRGEEPQGDDDLGDERQTDDEPGLG
jgi:hypothetical protein